MHKLKTKTTIFNISINVFKVQSWLFYNFEALACNYFEKQKVISQYFHAKTKTYKSVFFTKRVYLIKELVVHKKFNQLMKKFENFDK